MYQVIGLKNLLVAFAAIALAIFFWRLETADPATWIGHLPLVGQAISLSSLAIIGVGQSPLFPVICRIPWIRDFAPDLSGKWDVTLVSNWPVIAEMAGETAPETATITAKVRVKARLLKVSVNLDSDSRYSASKTVSVSASRDEDTGDVKLYYVYANHTSDPAQIDSSHHFGAAFVDFVGHGKAMTASGLYWSNRNWKKGWNTAGTLAWKRPGDFMKGWWGWLKP